MKDTFKTNDEEKGRRRIAGSARAKSGDRIAKPEIRHLGYRPQATYQLDLEVFSMADLRERAKDQLGATHRYEFHTLVLVTRGVSTQVVDFKSIACAAGSLLVLRSGQAHKYGLGEDWDGWNVLFRPEFVLAAPGPRDLTPAVDLDRLPEHMILRGDELRAVTASIQQLREDTRFDAPRDDVSALLRHQLHALLTRLAILVGRQQGPGTVVSPALQRFKRFRKLVEERFAHWHQVADYAKQLGYTEKTLARAVEAATGATAKAFIASRVNLEAKRLLVHTDLTVTLIADKLGFEEATNFSKFFKRDAGCTPAEFRQKQRTLL